MKTPDTLPEDLRYLALTRLPRQSSLVTPASCWCIFDLFPPSSQAGTKQDKNAKACDKYTGIKTQSVEDRHDPFRRESLDRAVLAVAAYGLDNARDAGENWRALQY